MAAAVEAAPPVRPRPAHTMVRDKQMKRHHSVCGYSGERRDSIGMLPHPSLNQGRPCNRSLTLPAGFELVQSRDSHRQASNSQKLSKGNLSKAKSKLCRMFGHSPEEKDDGRMAGRELPRPPNEDEDEAFTGSPMLGVPAQAAFVIPSQQTVVTAPLTMIRHPSRPSGESGVGRHQAIHRVSSWGGVHSPQSSAGLGQHRPLQRCVDRRLTQRNSLNIAPGISGVPMFYPADCTLLTPDGEFDPMSGMNSMQPVCFPPHQHPLFRTTSLPVEVNVRGHRPLQRLVSNDSIGNASMRSRSNSDSMSNYANSPGFDVSRKYRPFEWFFGQLARERAEELLHKYGQDGDYLVRERDSYPGSYAISIRKNSKVVRHFRVYDEQHGYSCDSRQAHTSPSLIDLVFHHEKVPLTGKGNNSEVFYLDCCLDRSAIPDSEGIPEVSDSVASSYTDLSARSPTDDDAYFDPSAMKSVYEEQEQARPRILDDSGVHARAQRTPKRKKTTEKKASLSPPSSDDNEDTCIPEEQEDGGKRGKPQPEGLTFKIRREELTDVVYL